MGQHTSALLAFAVYLILMATIGIYAWLKTRGLSDYILGGRRLGPLVSALSAGASDMSGWLLMGLPGLAYTSGLGSVWISLGLLGGTWANWSLMARRLRAFSIRSGNALTISAYLEKRFNDTSHLLRTLSALIILIFFTIYTASGLIGGGKLFEQVFHLPYHWAVLIGAAAIISYTLLGGFLAVSLTDVVQGLLMSAALIIVPLYTIYVGNSRSDIPDAFYSADGGALLDMFSDNSGSPYSLISIASFLGWGLGYLGQPHILARFKAIRSPADIPSARRIACTWTAFCLAGASFTGLAGLIFFEIPLSDPETVFISLVKAVFHPVPSGILLAAVLAAIMSTADSQLLVASSALSEDLYRTFLGRNATTPVIVRISRLCVVLVSLIASGLALSLGHGVLDVTALAWAGFGAAFGPPLALSLYWRGMSRAGAGAGILAGGLCVVIWRGFFDFGGIFKLYEIIPGVLVSTLASVIFSWYSGPDVQTRKIFDASISDLRREKAGKMQGSDKISLVSNLEKPHLDNQPCIT